MVAVYCPAAENVGDVAFAVACWFFLVNCLESTKLKREMLLRPAGPNLKRCGCHCIGPLSVGMVFGVEKLMFDFWR